MTEIRSRDRRERLARALRENLRRRKTRDRASADTAPDGSLKANGPPSDSDVSEGLPPLPNDRR